MGSGSRKNQIKVSWNMPYIITDLQDKKKSTRLLNSLPNDEAEEQSYFANLFWANQDALKNPNQSIDFNLSLLV